MVIIGSIIIAIAIVYFISELRPDADSEELD